MNPTRRKTVLGLGSLAFGSGAVLSSAAFQSAVEPSADLRVVAARGLEVKAGDAFDDEGGVVADGDQSEKYVPFDSNPDFFDSESGGLEDIDIDDVPVATVNRRDENVNGDVIAQLAVDLSKDEFKFKNILQVENTGTDSVKIAIRYRDDENDEDVYGDAVKDDTNDIGEQLVQRMFIFKSEVQDGTDTLQISPDGGDDDEIPNDDVEINPGETRNIDLRINFEAFGSFGNSIDPKKRIRDAADLDGSPFEGQLDTVQLLDGIIVGNDDDEII